MASAVLSQLQHDMQPRKRWLRIAHQEEVRRMATEHEDRAAPRDRQEAALTPRPVRLLLIGRVKPGAETSLREIQVAFPYEAAAEAGIAAAEAFIGSGYYAVGLEMGGDDTQAILADFFNDARVREFRNRLEPVVESLPGPDFHFGVGDRFHQAAAGETGSASSPVVYGTADLPFAASMYRWRSGEQPQLGKQPHGRLGA
jgi:hypothetical protein